MQLPADVALYPLYREGGDIFFCKCRGGISFSFQVGGPGTEGFALGLGVQTPPSVCSADATVVPQRPQGKASSGSRGEKSGVWWPLSLFLLSDAFLAFLVAVCCV
uniref:Uncharacterized protein n=1 Tax=Cyanistes caeruleus TaxID=156563 RepID=A0A8C0V7L1_CYACU